MIEKKLALLQHLNIDYFEYEGDYIKGIKEEFEVQFQEYLKDNEEITFEKYLIEEAEFVEDYVSTNNQNYYATDDSKDYFILNDTEAEHYFDDYLESLLDEVEPCAKSRYFDRESWKEDVKLDTGRGLLANYDGIENKKRVDDVDYFIYRTS